MLDAAAEQRILRQSIGVTVLVSAFGLLSGSLSIVFDGVFSTIDAAMSGLALFVSRLVSRPGDDRRFQFGYWHIEPMVLAFNGGTLMLACFYAFLNAVDSFLAIVCFGNKLDVPRQAQEHPQSLSHFRVIFCNCNTYHDCKSLYNLGRNRIKRGFMFLD